MFNERRELGEVEGCGVSWLIIVKGCIWTHLLKAAHHTSCGEEDC